MEKNIKEKNIIIGVIQNLKENKDGKKYKVKEYNNWGVIIFEGEYKDGTKYKGKEYNNKGELIFKREYKYKDKAKRIDFFSDRLIVEK